MWLGSSDLMHRNLDRRVELLVRVNDPGHERTLRDLLSLGMDDATASWWLGPDGTWTRHHVDSDGTPLRDLQAYLVQIRRGRRPVSKAGRAKPRHPGGRDRAAGKRLSQGRTGSP
jgi:polyphosphate kinase